MKSVEAMIVSLVVHATAWCICATFVRSVRPRSLGLTIGLGGLVGFSISCLATAVVPISTTYFNGPSATDLLAIWPLPLGLLGLCLVRTSRETLAGLCECGYNLKGNRSGHCPECGRSIEARGQRL